MMNLQKVLADHIDLHVSKDCALSHHQLEYYFTKYKEEIILLIDSILAGERHWAFLTLREGHGRLRFFIHNKTLQITYEEPMEKEVLDSFSLLMKKLTDKSELDNIIEDVVHDAFDKFN